MTDAQRLRRHLSAIVLLVAGCSATPEPTPAVIELESVERQWTGQAEVQHDGTAEIRTNVPTSATCSASTSRGSAIFSWYSEPTWNAKIYRAEPGAVIRWACIDRGESK